MKKVFIKISAFILLTAYIIMPPISTHASEISEKTAASNASTSYLRDFLLKSDENRKIAANSLNFNSHWNSARFLTANECFNFLIKADGDLVSTSLKSNPQLMLTVVNVDFSSHIFKNTNITLTSDNPVIVYQIASEESSYPILWIVDAVNGTVYSAQDYPGAAIYEMKDNSIIHIYSNDDKCLLWR